MPYRRLPNTDKARVRALTKALEMGKAISPVELAFSQASLQKVRYFLPLMEQTMIQQQQAYANQITRSKEYVDLYKKAKLYISHFIQVINMAVARGELKEEIKTIYNLRPNAKRVPSLNTEAEVIKWGERIIKGESERLSQGGNPITNPTMALVRVRYEKFLDSYRKQKSLQDINNRALTKVAELRADADAIILNVWNEVETKLDYLPDAERRSKCSEYGIVYVYRKYEKLNSEYDEGDETMTLQEAMSRKKQFSFHFSENKVEQTTSQN